MSDEPFVFTVLATREASYPAHELVHWMGQLYNALSLRFDLPRDWQVEWAIAEVTYDGADHSIPAIRLTAVPS